MAKKEAKIDLDHANGKKPKLDVDPVHAKLGDSVDWLGGNSITGRWSVIFGDGSPFSRSRFEGGRGTRDGDVAINVGRFKYDVEHRHGEEHTAIDPIIVIRSSDPLVPEGEEILRLANNLAEQAEELARKVEEWLESESGSGARDSEANTAG
jgi:hypothetical protein